MKKTVYVDMDGVLADYLGRCKELNIDPDEAKHYSEFFISLKPIDGAIESINKLFEKYNVFISSLYHILLFFATAPRSFPYLFVFFFLLHARRPHHLPPPPPAPRI